VNKQISRIPTDEKFNFFKEAAKQAASNEKIGEYTQKIIETVEETFEEEAGVKDIVWIYEDLYD
jgi:hypothetical protein